MDPLIVKYIEVMIMAVLVFGAVAAILVAIVWDVVQAAIKAARRRDQIAVIRVQRGHAGARQTAHNLLAHLHVRA